MSRPEQVYKALRLWLDGPSGLDEAIRRTVEGGLFPEEDVQFAVAHLRESLTPEVLERWWMRAGYGPGTDSQSLGSSTSDTDSYPIPKPEFKPESDYDSDSNYDNNPDSVFESAVSKSVPDHDPSRAPLKILCLHAGNLPLVGLQDVVAVLLSGNRYYGKLSRKDPWLIASFVDVCRELGLPEAAGSNTELGSFSGLRADAVLFTGSEKSVPGVMDELLRLKAVNRQPQTRYLIRTAQLSVAFVHKEQSAGELLEAITRYGGRGCRSVGVVVSPFSLEEYAGALCLAEAGRNEKGSVPEPGAESDGKSRVPEQYAGSDQNDHVPKPGAGPSSGMMNGPKKYLYAYAVAAELPTLQLCDGQFLFIESDGTGLMREGVILWIRGGVEELDDLRNRLSGRIQSVFTDEAELADDADDADDAGKAEVADDADDADKATVAGDNDFETLNKAQRPEFDWCPDGVDTLRWLAGQAANTRRK